MTITTTSTSTSTTTLLFVLSAALSYGSAHGFSSVSSSVLFHPRSSSSSSSSTTSLGGTASPTIVENNNETFQRSLLAARIANSKKAVDAVGRGGEEGEWWIRIR